MNLYDKIFEYLDRNGPSDIQSITKSIPELDEFGGNQRTLLLLRLNSQFIQVSEDINVPKYPPDLEGSEEIFQYTTWHNKVNDKGVVLRAAKAYFRTTPKKGMPLDSLVRVISNETRINSEKVKAELVDYFVTINTNIFNRPNRQEDK